MGVYMCVTITCLCTYVGRQRCKRLQVCQRLETTLIPEFLAKALVANIQQYQSYCVCLCVCFDMCGCILNYIEIQAPEAVNLFDLAF